jgi:hypothetical protein
LPHQGTKVRITQLEKKIDALEVLKYCEETLYGLVLPIASNEPMCILVNQRKVDPQIPSGKDVLINTKYGQIKGNLTSAKTGTLDVLCKGVKIKEVNPDPTHPVKGFVNVDWIEPTTDRHDFIMDTDEYKTFYLSLRNYIISNFPSQYEIVSKRKKKVMKLLAKLMGEVIREVGLAPKIIAEAKKYERIPIKKEEVKKHWEEKPPYVDILSKIGRTKFKDRPVKTDYGILWTQGPCGRENPAVLVDPVMKYVIFNSDNDYFKKFDELHPREQAVSMVPLYARGYALILRGYENINEYQHFVDDISARLLSKLMSKLIRPE